MDLDFEQALMTEGTVKLKEGIDVNSLGVLDSPGAQDTIRSPKSLQPSTPKIIPPTPVAGPSSNRMVMASSSSNDVFSDASDDVERQINRRSMYRSPGTSSSPDLATLLRRTKERGGIPNLKDIKDKRRESPPPLPSGPANRKRSSTGFAPSSPVTPLPKGKNKPQNSPDWILTGNSPSQNDSPSKPAKSSMRAKTSAFIGKMLGQNTVRERSKTDASAPTTPASSVFQNLPPPPPPVPPLPLEHQRITPSGSPIADIFSTTGPSKPLPPIMGQHTTTRDGEDPDDKSMVFVEKIPRTPSPNPSHKRRSMSVGDTELKKVMSLGINTSLPRSPPDLRHEPDTSMNGVLTDFKGELSSLDPSPTLDLQDPGSSRPASYARSSANGDSYSDIATSPSSSRHSSMLPMTPTLTIHSSPQNDDAFRSSPTSAIVPPRFSSLQAPVRSVPARQNLSPLRTRSGNSFGQQNNWGLRVLHRSTASSSEPSLIPNTDDIRALSRAPASSQQDLTVNDLTFTRLQSPISPQSKGDDFSDMETRAKDMASRCWNEDEEFLSRDKIAEWLGGTGRINKLALQNYVDFFDFSGLRLDTAFRRLCAKLYLKGETQQVDRILEEFSRRYWDCNPGSLYGSANIVHAVSYSLLLLNTDLHVADLTTRMSRNQFVRNTLTAIQSQFHPSPTTDLNGDDGTESVRGNPSDASPMATFPRSKRSDSITSWNSISKDALLSSTNSITVSTPTGHFSNGSSPSVQVSTPTVERRNSIAYDRTWEAEMESLLKDMYNAIKSQQILQPLGSSRSSMSSLSPGSSSMMRNRSLRGQQDRLMTLKRGSIRGIQSIMGSQGASPYSSNSSIDGRVSPSPSFATSAHEAIYNSSSSFLTPALGFASNLSHTIIREAQEDDNRSIRSEDSSSTTISITDEELALLGAPWAKEGMLCRKQYWECTGKRAKDKGWMDVFVVIQKGELNMFIFGDNGTAGSGYFGGGNWLANAQPVGTVKLSHSLAHALPPPGYNRQRPYCMVLTLANGGVYFFQAGTEELVNEWVSTCNYWAARMSKEPLAGGVSNMEYGWNRVSDDLIHTRSQSDSESFREPDFTDALSVRSGRSTRSKFGWRDGAATVRGGSSPWADRTIINEWKPPLPPTMDSTHDEETQLDALRRHVVSLKNELKQHNELRQPMVALYPPRSSNSVKAQTNWERKSQYLLTEIVKYDSYIDSLQAAMSLRLKKRGEKALERALNTNGVDDPTSSKWKGPDEETIHETDEPTTPGVDRQFNRHHRETAEADGQDEER